MSFPKYPAYKDSGVEWLGEVPEHWALIPIKHLASLNPRKSDFRIDTQLLCSFVPMEKLKTGVLLLDEERQIKEVINGYTYFEDGDVLQAKVTPCFENKNIAIASGLTNGIGFGSSEINVLRPHHWMKAEYLYYRLQEDNYMDFCTSSMMGAGGLKRVPTDVINNFTIAAPGGAEQTQIARFLDHETARIDALIEEQQRLIELLKEKRQAVISHAVTKGLDPTVPMKDSGVEWLGEVPEHWVVSRVKNIVSFITSGPRGWSDYIDDSGEDIFLQSGDMDNRLNVLFDKAKRIITPDGAEGVRTRIQKGDVLVCITGANTGRVAVVKALDQTCYVNQHLGLLRPRSLACDSQYLGYALASTSCQTYFSIEQYGLKEGLSLTDLAEAPLAIPPIAEQVALVKRIEEQLIALHRLSADAERAALILAERRSALISAAVTGKIDVRNWQPPAGQCPVGDAQNRTEPEAV